MDQVTAAVCPKCEKTAELCVCDQIKPLETRLHVLILQHPQEPDKELGSARLAHLALPNSTLKVGLSWPNLTKALGRPTQNSRWAVLYLGSGIKSDKPKGPGLFFVDKKGTVLPSPEPNEFASELASELEGIVVIDGTWSQSKALWWRNAWLLKLRRVVLVPKRKSLYGELRKEPRRECLSTIESIAETLESLKEKPEVSEQLRDLFGALLDRKRKRR